MSKPENLKTIKRGCQDLIYKEKGSKFIGFARHVGNAQEALDFFDSLKKEHYGANHCCYAYRLGIDGEEVRANDDGEPTHSAGTPILGQIQSFGLTNTAVAVVRYFGGTKLGVGGLIKAYKNTAQHTLESCEFEIEVAYVTARLVFDYPNIGVAMQWLKQGALKIQEQKLDQKCQISFSIPQSRVEESRLHWQSFPEISIKFDP